MDKSSAVLPGFAKTPEQIAKEKAEFMERLTHASLLPNGLRHIMAIVDSMKPDEVEIVKHMLRRSRARIAQICGAMAQLVT